MAKTTIAMLDAHTLAILDHYLPLAVHLILFQVLAENF